MIQDYYDSQIDIWSIGCIFAELAMTTKSAKRKVIFPGTCCYPISEPQSTGRRSDYKEKDQLELILKTLGQLKPSDMDFIQSNG